MRETNIFKAFQKFRQLLRIESREITHLYIYALFSGLLSLVLPIGIQSIINFIQTGRTSTSWFVIIFVVVISIALNGIMQLMQLRITENLQQKIFVWSSMEMTYRFRYIDHQKLGLQYPPELANRFFDTLVIQKGLSKVLIDMPTSILQIIFGVVLLSLYHPFFIAFSFILILFLFLILYFTSRNAYTSSLEESKAKYKTAHWIQEVARASSSFEVLGKSDFPLRKNDKYATGYVKARESHFSILWKQFTYLIVFKIVIALTLLLIGGLLVINQQMTIGQFIASEIIILLVISSIEKLILSLSTMYDVLTSTEKLSEIADYPLKDVVPSTKLADFVPHDTGFTLHEVSFVSPYYDRLVLDKIDCVIDPGSKIAIISNSQLTSETLLKIIQLHYTPTSGQVLLNGIKAEHYDLTAVKGSIGSFMSSDTIFYGTILDNILLGRKDVDSEHLNELLKKLRLFDYINSFPKGLDTYLLSGGKFLPPDISAKIILARGLVGSPSLLLLDKDWQALYEMDRFTFDDALHPSNTNLTVLACVTDRTLLDMFETILVIEDGRLKAFGRREEVIGKITIENYCHV
jgi:ABC-type bacteriocin/lantibiotic exporter with double-glycine peptidase domain